MTELLTALAKALPTIGAATKSQSNDFLKSKYANINNVIQALEPIANHGLWFIQRPILNENGACIETFFVHESGQELSAGVCFVPASKKDPQGFGSAMTYARRYGLLSAFGMATDDDDGNAAQKTDNDVNQVPAIEYINDDQRQELQSMIDGYGFNVINICKHYKINSLKDIALAEFINVKNAINKKYDKQQEKDAL